MHEAFSSFLFMLGNGAFSMEVNAAADVGSHALQRFFLSLTSTLFFFVLVCEVDGAKDGWGDGGVLVSNTLFSSFVHCGVCLHVFFFIRVEQVGAA